MILCVGVCVCVCDCVLCVVCCVLCMCACVCVCVCGGDVCVVCVERETRGGVSGGGWVGVVFVVRYTRISQLIPSAVSIRINGAQQIRQVKRMIGGLGNMLFSILFSNLKMCKIQGFLSVNLSEARDNLCANFGEQN